MNVVSPVCVSPSQATLMFLEHYFLYLSVVYLHKFPDCFVTSSFTCLWFDFTSYLMFHEHWSSHLSFGVLCNFTDDIS